MGGHPAVLGVGDQVLIEVRLRAVEGELSDQARRELTERNLALLEPLVAFLHGQLARIHCRVSMPSSGTAGHYP
jgi:hypothetical protein